MYSVGLTFCMGLGLCATAGSAIGVFLLLIILASVAALSLRKYAWTMIPILGVIAGFFFGSFLFTVIANSSGWEAEWGYWFLTCFFAVIGCYISWRLDETVVITLTSLVGSYLFMRAWTLFFPGIYPSESKIVSSASSDTQGSFEMTGMFWVFVLLWIGGSIFAYCF